MGVGKPSLDTMPDSRIVNIPSLPVPYVAEDSPAVLSMSSGVEVDSKLSEVGNQAARKSMTLKLHTREESDAQSGDKHGLHESLVLSPAVGEPTVIEEEQSLEEQGPHDDVLSPTAREPPVTEEDRSGLIETESPHSVHEHRKNLKSFPSAGELTKWTLKPEKRLEEERAKSAPAATVAPSDTQLRTDRPAATLAPLDTQLHTDRPAATVAPSDVQLHTDRPAKIVQEPKTALLEAVEQDVEANSPSRGSSESSQLSSSSDIYHSLSNEGFEHVVTSASPFISSELTTPHLSEWKRERAPPVSLFDWKRDPSPLTTSLTGSSVTTISGGGSESTISTLSVQSASSVSSSIIEAAKVGLFTSDHYLRIPCGGSFHEVQIFRIFTIE